ncbi:gamma-glutamylcyclotransferase [Acuticoccus kandeliae]|uniref:gamma-glutamylcyclotransferase n=1 Tax=Acuticoccus kandeliae TaxID=2073160 RepID=UPI000D3E073D|nr:gamma-glutamylcyclotransferase [Acuticoccus kandeliae]
MVRIAKTLSLTPEIVARVERLEPDPGPEPGTEEHSDADLDQLARALLDEHCPETLLVFAYGSLIWNPEFEVRSSARVRLGGWHRAFCMRLTRWRGTREVPGLMMALDRGGSCTGMLYALRGADHRDQIIRLLEREIDAKPPTNVARWVGVATEAGPAKALTFVADPKGPAYAGRMPLEEVAGIVARAAGHWGSTAIYLQRTVEQLEAHGIRDRNLWRLQEMVAREILAMPAPLRPA